MTAHKHLGPRSFYKTALAIAIPVMLQGLIQNMVSLIDNFMVAGLGDMKMSGVNVTNQLIFVLFVALMTLMGAGGMFMSQFNGAKDSEGMRQAFRFKIHTSSALALVAVALTVILPRQILSLLLNTNTEREAIVEQGSAYLSVIVLTFFPIAWSMSIGSSLREIGKVRAPLIISVAATLVNTFFNWMLIYGNLGAPRLEVRGAAIATLIARLVELAAFIVYVHVRKPGFFVRFVELWKVNLRLFTTILSKSGFILLSEMSWVLTETVMTAVYNGRGGSEIVSGMAAGWAIANIFFLVFQGIHVSTGVIVGGTLGRNELDLARDQARWIRNGAIFAGLALAVVQASSIAIIPVVYGNLSDGARLVTRNMLLVIACYLPLWTYLNAQFATARSGGDAIMGMWVDGVVNIAMFLPAIFLLAAFTDLGPIAMYALVKITDIVKIAIAAWQLRTGRWVKNLTIEHGSAAGALTAGGEER